MLRVLPIAIAVENISDVRNEFEEKGIKIKDAVPIRGIDASTSLVTNIVIEVENTVKFELQGKRIT